MIAPRAWRLLLLAAILPVLSVGTFIRSPKPADNRSQAVTMTRLAAPPRPFGEFRFLAAWHLTSANSNFGSYSALASLGEGRLLAVSDFGQMLEISVPDAARRRPSRLGPFSGSAPKAKWLTDAEAMTRNPATGQLWLAYEGSNFVTRFNRAQVREGFAYPNEMRRWGHNSGPEAMVRLRDGRFVILAERGTGWFPKRTPGVIFASDPVADGVHLDQFEFAPPEGYSPTDMAELPDGRVVMLLRTWTLGVPPRFPSKLAVADPTEIRPGGVWRAQIVADLYGAVPGDNFEGIAVEPMPGDGATVWIISDDNGASFQRTLLLKFAWEPETKKAPGSTGRLSETR